MAALTWAKDQSIGLMVTRHTIVGTAFGADLARPARNVRTSNRAREGAPKKRNRTWFARDPGTVGQAWLLGRRLRAGDLILGMTAERARSSVGPQTPIN